MSGLILRVNEFPDIEDGICTHEFNENGILIRTGDKAVPVEESPTLQEILVAYWDWPTPDIDMTLTCPNEGRHFKITPL